LKIKILSFLAAGTPGFSEQQQLTASTNGYHTTNLFFFLFCDWQTAWSLLYNPFLVNGRVTIDDVLKVNNEFEITLNHF
jgi:hypothetical protein